MDWFTTIYLYEEAGYTTGYGELVQLYDDYTKLFPNYPLDTEFFEDYDIDEATQNYIGLL